MIDEETNRRIEEFIKRTGKLLPDSFESEDLLEDLKAHIYEGLEDKIRSKPSEKELVLLQEVLDELGTPEEIAEEYGLEHIDQSDSSKKEDRAQYYIIRLVAAFIVAVLAAWIVSIVTEGAIDFYFAVVVLMAFAVIEWFVRAKQTGE